MKVVVINGEGGVGKDAFIKNGKRGCKEDGDLIFSVSTVDWVKEEAKKIGWNGVKDDKGRKFLSDLKDAFTEYNDMPFLKVVEEIESLKEQATKFGRNTNNLVIFVHCREPEEIQKFVDKYEATTLLIRRPDAEGHHKNHADIKVYDYDYDYVYFNVYDLDKLQEDASQFIRFIRKLKEGNV